MRQAITWTNALLKFCHCRLLNTIHMIRYAHGFVVFCFLVVVLFILSMVYFTHVIQGCFACNSFESVGYVTLVVFHFLKLHLLRPRLPHQYKLFQAISLVSPWASYQIRKIAGCACARNAGNVFPHCRFQRKPLVSDPGMHHGTCVTHVPWCMSGSLTCGDGENVPGIPGACAPAILRIWQEAHGIHRRPRTARFD